MIFTTLSHSASSFSSVISVALKPELEEQVRESKRITSKALPTLGFSKEDKVGTFQPYDDALVVALHIGGYDVKRVLVDQGSGAEIMYIDLYRGLNLKLGDLCKYDSLLVRFDGRTLVPLRMIRLLMQAWNKVVEVDFIMVEAYSPYTAILARPWLYAMGAVSSTMHIKVKYPTEGRVRKLV